MKPVCGRLGILIGFIFLLVPARMSADVSVAMEVKYGKATNEPSKRTLRIKGLKMRVETRRGSDVRVTIYDLEKGKRFRLDASRREIFVLDLAAVSRRWKTQVIEEKLTRNIQPTGRRKEISGMSCDEYTFELAAPLVPWNGDLKRVSQIARDNGTVCVSQNIPAGVEYTTFVHEAKKRGYSLAAAFCSPTFSLVGSYFYAVEPNVIVLSAETESGFENDLRTGHPSYDAIKGTATVLSIKSEAIPDEDFQIPTNWKVKKDPQFN